MKYVYSALGTLLILSGCQGQNSGVTESPTPVLQQTEYKPAVVEFNAKTGVTKTTEEVTDESLKRMQKEAQLTILGDLPISVGYNTNLYYMNNDQFKSYAYVSPKVYAFSTSDGARISILENDDGTVSIPFHVAMIDGLTEKISDPSVRGTTATLPSNYLVQNKDALYKEISEMGKNKIALLPGCLKHLTVKVVDREYDVTPKDLYVSDKCDISKPFTVALRVGKKEAQYILQDALYNNLVDIRADYQAQVPYMVAKVNISFDKKRVYDMLEVRIQGNYKGIIAGDARKMTEKILEEQAATVNIVGNYTAQLQSAVDSAMAIFFKEVEPIDKVKMGCSPSIACVTFNQDYRSNERSLDFNFQQTSSTLAPRNFSSTTRLQPLNDRIVATQKPLMNELKDSIETGLTVAPGDIIEIEPTSLYIEKRELDRPNVVRSDNNVCVQTKNRRVCEPSYDPCVKGQKSPTKPYCLPKRLCWDEEVCARTENQWLETITYAMGIGEMITVDRPVGMFPQIYEGLYLRFTYSETVDGKIIDQVKDCPLRNFERVGNGQFISVRIDNNENCKVFGRNRNSPMLSVMNDIRMSFRYKKGTDKRNWKGDVLDRATEETYYSPIGFNGKFMIRGYRWGNELVK